MCPKKEKKAPKKRNKDKREGKGGQRVVEDGLGFGRMLIGVRGTLGGAQKGQKSIQKRKKSAQKAK
jgi:hypothetical protein